MRKMFLPALACLTLLLANIAQAGDTTKIKIVVKNVNGKPVDRADVIVRFGGRSIRKFGKTVHTQWEMRSSQEGIADIPEMPKGKIRIQVVAKGYQSFGDIFDVNEDERTIDISLSPPQKQYSAHE